MNKSMGVYDLCLPKSNVCACAYECLQPLSIFKDADICFVNVGDVALLLLLLFWTPVLVKKVK